VTYVCLGHFWWPLWWPLANRVPWRANDTPGTLVNPWASTKGAKGTTVVVAVVVVIMVGPLVA
jgi:hypothetical protein